MGPFGRRPRAQEPIEEATPAEEALPEPVLELVAPPQPAPEVQAAASSEYRRVGDDLALLTVEVEADVATATALRLVAPGPTALEHPDPTSVTVLPGSGLARLTFVVHRHLPARAGDSLELAAGPDLRFTVPAPVQRPPIGSPETDVGDAAVASLAGDELFGLITMLEKRCSVAERVAADLRTGPTESVKLAQAYREIWDVRALLDSREEAHRRSADLVEAAEAALREQESLAAAEAERARANLADAVTRAGEIENERDEALAMALEYETAAADARAAAAAAAEQAERSAALRREPPAIAASFVQAQRERLKHTSLDEQRAEVAALERQLERLKAR